MSEQPTPFNDLISETRDGEWGEGAETPGHTLCEVIRGTDFADLHDASLQLPRRWIPVHLVERKALVPSDILIETAGGTAKQSTGRTALLTEAFFERHNQMPVLCSSFARHLRVDPSKVSADYLYYVLQGLYRGGYMAVFNLQHTGISRFQFTSFRKKTLLALAPIAAQPKIAAILSAYNDLIANNQRRIALLESMAEEIYREWFVRMRFPGWRRANYKQTLPEDWAVVPMESLFKTVSGGTPSRSSSDNFGGEVAWVKTGELKSMFVNSTEETLSARGLASSAAKVLPRHTVVMAMYCAMPDVAILGVDAATNQACCSLLPKRPAIGYAWTYFFARKTLEQLVNFAHGAAQQNLSQEIIRKFRVLYPSDKLVACFCEQVTPLLEEVEVVSLATTCLGQVRDALLPRLISGKLKVDQLDIRVPPRMRTESEAVA